MTGAALRLRPKTGASLWVDTALSLPGLEEPVPALPALAGVAFDARPRLGDLLGRDEGERIVGLGLSDQLVEVVVPHVWILMLAEAGDDPGQVQVFVLEEVGRPRLSTRSSGGVGASIVRRT